VTVTARRADRLEELVAGLRRGLAVPCDLGRAEDLERPVAATLEAFGRVDVLVNNAGMAYTGPAEDEPWTRSAPSWR
jgi:short-subunit dehydrogenase